MPAPPTAIRFKLTHPSAKAPVQARPHDAGYDICATEGDLILPGETKLIRTGVILEMPDDFECQVRSRSGLAFKHGVTVLNSPGTIDAGYRDEVGVLLVNHGTKVFAFAQGDRVAQLVFQRRSLVELVEIQAVADSVRGTGGFGSTGQR